MIIKCFEDKTFFSLKVHEKTAVFSLSKLIKLELAVDCQFSKKFILKIYLKKDENLNECTIRRLKDFTNFSKKNLCSLGDHRAKCFMVE